MPADQPPSLPRPLPAREELEKSLTDCPHEGHAWDCFRTRTRQLLSLLPLLEYVGHTDECRKDRALWNEGYGCKATGSKDKFTCCCGLDTLKASCGLPEKGSAS